MSIDVEKVRQDTPGCREVLHFNNAGASLPPRQVTEAVVEHLRLEATIGGYEAAVQQETALEEGVYSSIARLLNAQPGEIAVVESATHAWDVVFYSLPWQPGDRVLCSQNEYSSNYIALLQIARQKGIEIEVIPNDEQGQISLEGLRKAIDERVKLISLVHVPTNSGLVNPAEAVGQIAREAGIPYLLDACQSVGQQVVDVQAIGCDFLSATGRKYLRAPRGTGFLYVGQEWLERLEPPFLDSHAASWVSPTEYRVREDARRFETFETNFAAKLGLGVAVDYALEVGLAAIEERVTALAARLRQQLAEIPGVTIQDRGAKLCGIVTFTVTGHEPAQIKTTLNQQGINVWTSGVGAALLDMQTRQLNSVVRASIHYYNSEEEIERFCQVLSELIKQ